MLNLSHILHCWKSNAVAHMDQLMVLIANYTLIVQNLIKWCFLWILMGSTFPLLFWIWLSNYGDWQRRCVTQVHTYMPLITRHRETVIFQ